MYAPKSARVAHHRASLARRTQSYPPDHPRVVEAQRALAIASVADHVSRVAAEYPDATAEIIAQLLDPA